jgi:hypothetical protein
MVYENKDCVGFFLVENKMKICSPVNLILSKEFNSRGQVDLMDFQSNPDGKYKFIMVYQDHLTKFCNIKPLTSKKAAEVVFNLIDVFTIFGAPQTKLRSIFQITLYIYTIHVHCRSI